MSNPEVQFSLFMGDNCLILAQGNGRWAGHAPALEEDIAIANVALDLIGQARLWLGHAGLIEGAGRSADDLAFLRDEFDFRNCQLVEQPNGDYGRTLMRQYLFDAWHRPMVAALAQDSKSAMGEIAAKAANEVAYHLERSRDLIVRLGDGTAESRQRMQAAADHLWPFTGEFRLIAADSTFPDAAAIALRTAAQAFDAEVRATFAEAGLKIAEAAHRHQVGAKGQHTEHLGHVLAELQFLQRAYPGAKW